MKVQDFAYNVVIRTMEYLEQEQHYKIPEDTRKDVAQKILSELPSLIRQS